MFIWVANLELDNIFPFALIIINCLIIFNHLFLVNRNVSEPVQGRATNNAGEIQGATRAITDAGRMGIPKLRVNTDSEFLVKSANQWMPTWK